MVKANGRPDGTGFHSILGAVCFKINLGQSVLKPQDGSIRISSDGLPVHASATSRRSADWSYGILINGFLGSKEGVFAVAHMNM